MRLSCSFKNDSAIDAAPCTSRSHSCAKGDRKKHVVFVTKRVGRALRTSSDVAAHNTDVVLLDADQHANRGMAGSLGNRGRIESNLSAIPGFPGRCKLPVGFVVDDD